MKKWLALFLALCLMISFSVVAEDLPAETPKQEQHTCGDYSYILLEDGTAEIDRYSGSEEILTVPGSLDGIRVTSIGDYAFSWCTSLTGIMLPDSVTSIGDGAFSGCESMTSITIPDGVTSIGSNPFSSCNKLEEIIVSPDHPYLVTIGGVLFSKPDKRLVCYPCGLSAETYSVPDGIQTIGAWAFYFCNSLTGITLPDSVTSIGDFAFSDCRSLTGITLPDSVTSIGDYAFSSCDSLTVTVSRNSYAGEYCKEKKIKYMYPDSLDWLNN